MKSISRRADHLIVVDPSIDDYAALWADERLQDLPWRHCRDGEMALRYLASADATLWIVNEQLPDMTGVSLLELIRRRARYAPVFLVGDCYALEQEIAARAAGASAYLCKPVNTAWLRMCRNILDRAAVRRGSPHSLS